MTVKKNNAAAGVGKKNAAQLQAMLLKPTNNFGLASLFKNFVDINQSNQQGQVSQKFKSPYPLKNQLVSILAFQR